jgi:hypothetical protein
MYAQSLAVVCVVLFVRAFVCVCVCTMWLIQDGMIPDVN